MRRRRRQRRPHLHRQLRRAQRARRGRVQSGRRRTDRLDLDGRPGQPLRRRNRPLQQRPLRLLLLAGKRPRGRSLHGASGYSLASDKVFATFGDAKIAINPVKHRLYAATNFGTVFAYDTETGSQVESFGPVYARGVAVDDANDTVFLGAGSKVQEWKGVVVPDVTTGEPVGNTEVSASVGLGGGGTVTECFFEFGTSPEPESFGPTHPACEPGAPYVTDQPTVTAELPGLTGETTYYYRVVAKNANGTSPRRHQVDHPPQRQRPENRTGDEPHRTTAILNAIYEGTNEDTHYYFEWEPGAGSCPCVNKTATPPGDERTATSRPHQRSPIHRSAG